VLFRIPSILATEVITGLPSGNLVTHSRELSTPFKPQCKDKGDDKLDDFHQATVAQWSGRPASSEAP